VERVAEPLSRRHIGSTESREVRGDNMKPVGEERDQIAEHVARAREAMQQQELRRIGWPGLAIENLEAVDIGGAVADGGPLYPPCRVPRPRCRKGCRPRRRERQ